MRLNFKIPNMKFKKIKMDGDEIMKEIDVEKLKKELKDLTHESFWDKFIKGGIMY